jgi:hypothetical protein
MAIALPDLAMSVKLAIDGTHPALKVFSPFTPFSASWILCGLGCKGPSLLEIILFTPYPHTWRTNRTPYRPKNRRKSLIFRTIPPNSA